MLEDGGKLATDRHQVGPGPDRLEDGGKLATDRHQVGPGPDRFQCVGYCAAGRYESFQPGFLRIFDIVEIPPFGGERR
jgi:hypothetical protein